MFLIMSAAYVDQELASEFGNIPPSFLPLGNKRLFQYQVSLAPPSKRVYLSVPESYPISKTDIDWLVSNGVTILSIPDGLSIGACIVSSVNISGCDINKSLSILYGDTLFSELPIGDDLVSVSEARDAYDWGVLNVNDGSTDGLIDCVIDGYFCFSNPSLLIHNIEQNEGSLFAGLKQYHCDVVVRTVKSNGWLDFGHVNTYFRSKATFTTQRAFNQLTVTPCWVEKSSTKNDKIMAESYWFENIPPELRLYTPQYLGRFECGDKVSYRLEYLYFSALNELFVFSSLQPRIWEKILSSCLDFISICQLHLNANEYKSAVNDLETLFTTKTEQRLSDYCAENNISLKQKWFYSGSSHDFSLEDVLDDIKLYLPKGPCAESVMHGDFCFSNILYDFRSGRIKTIDPRGITTSGEKTIYGDTRYDIAKLSHSVLGLYDWIIAGHYFLKIENNCIDFHIFTDDAHLDIQKIFIELVSHRFDLTEKTMYAMQIHLFLSMLPLHSDDAMRQKALFANAFRLYHIFKGMN